MWTREEKIAQKIFTVIFNLPDASNYPIVRRFSRMLASGHTVVVSQTKPKYP